MIIIKPSYRIRHITIDALEDITDAGATCYKSSPKSAESFVKKIMKSGHESVIEHAYASVKIICDRGVSHEIVRHRLASYSQESTRYCNYSKERFGGHITFIRPCFFPSINTGLYENAGYAIKNLNASKTVPLADKEWMYAMMEAERRYFELISLGCEAQQARSVLPNSLKTELVMTCNVREWRHFFKLRTSKAAHPQMREIAIPMLAEFKLLIPVIFDDIE